MVKLLNKCIILVLTFFLIAGCMPVCADKSKAPEPVTIDLPCTYSTVKVGIRSGGSASCEAKLSNKSGNGFELGYFDFSRRFHKIGNTEFTQISMRGDYGFELEDGTKVGPWHMLLEQVYSSFSDAKAAAEPIWGGFVGYINGQYRVLVGAYANDSKTNKSIKKRNLSAIPYTGSNTSVLVSETDTSELVLLLDSGDVTKLAVRPVLAEGKAETWFSGNAYYGDFEFYRNGGGLSVVNYVELEDYVKGVLPYEVGGNWPKDTLMAQAVCARTYAINNINSYIERGFDVRNDTYSQVYRGITGVTQSTEEAAEATAGKFVRCDGSICKVYYMSSDGGATDSGANVFGQSRPYLAGIEDKYESDVDFYGKDWKSELKSSKIEQKLNKAGLELSGLSHIEPVYSDTGNVIELKVSDKNGKTVNIQGEYCFRYLSLNSLRYTVSSYENEKSETVYVFDGHGWGHNCGLSQWGAYSMAQNHGASCDDIIGFYFSGAYIG